MNDFMDIVTGRRSIRKYDPKEVPPQALNTILESVRWAPSWNNTQCWEVVVVADDGIKKQLQSTLPPKGNPALNAIVQAPVVLALCGQLKKSGCYQGQAVTKFGDWFMFDLGIACQNICLTARELGLGTVVVGFFDYDRAADVLGVPEGYELVVLIPLGYPAQKGKAPARKAIDEFTHYERF